MEGGGNKKIKGGGDDPATSATSLVGSGSSGTQPGQGGNEDRASEVGVGVFSGSQAPGGGIHPLMNSVILEHLLKFLPPRVLATSRLVCRTWADLSLLTWRSNATVEICRARHGNGNESEYYLNDRERTSLGRFMDFWGANCLIKPYRQFHLKRWRFTGMTGNNMGAAPDVGRFWRGVGRQMTKLRMDNCNIAKFEHFMNIIIHSCPNLETLILQNFTVGFGGHGFSSRSNVAAAVPNPNPVREEHLNLKSLQLIYTPNNWEYARTVLRVDYTKLLSHFPHLTSIKVETEPARQYDEVLELLSAVKVVRAQGPQKLPIRELVTIQPLELEVLRHRQNDDDDDGDWGDPGQIRIKNLLLELRIPVQSIHLSNLRQVETQNLIEFSAGALTELFVEVAYLSPRCNFPYGLHLENLRHLTISEGFCRTLELLKYAPNLETLNIQGDPSPFSFEERVPDRPSIMETDLISNTFKPDLEDVKLPKLTTLRIYVAVRNDDLRCLVRWMPHVKALGMFLDDRQFATVCGNWKDLESLFVLGNRLTDSGVTGRMQIRGSGTRVVYPNITSLQKLEKFTARESTLTSASVYHGFLKLDRLRLIIFQRAEEIAVPAKRALVQKNVQLYG